jgi:hypothetical protein
MYDKALLERIGAYQDADGSYKRHRPITRNPEWDPTDPKAELKGMLVAYEVEPAPFPVILPLATDPDSIEEARVKAVRAGADFYHPKWGWLRWGVKPEKDHPENLGSGAIERPRRRVVVADAAAPAAAPARKE